MSLYKSRMGHVCAISRRYIHTLSIIFLLSSCVSAKAQQPGQPGAGQGQQAVDLISLGVQIGEVVPDVTITNLHKYRDKEGKSATIAKLSDFRGKLLILDFWATWCSPCVAMIPKMDSLQKAFGGNVQFLSVTYQKDEEVLPFLEKFEKQKGKHFDIPLVNGDSVLHDLFPHRYLPHYVWIDEDGLVAGITEPDHVNRERIADVLEGRKLDKFKEDLKIPYDNDQPFLLAGNGGNGEGILYHSVLTSHVKGMRLFTQVRMTNDGERARITCGNYSIAKLFQVAYSSKRHWFNSDFEHTIFNVNDTSRVHLDAVGNEYDNWLASGNGYCYELLVPIRLQDSLFSIMQQDLKRLFPQYQAEVRLFPDSVWLLTAEGEQPTAPYNRNAKSEIAIDTWEQQINNSTIGRWANRLNMMKACPLKMVDETGWENPMDMVLSVSPNDFEGMKKALQVYGITLEKAVRQVDKLVISDNT